MKITNAARVKNKNIEKQRPANMGFGAMALIKYILIVLFATQL